jgi:hypothetical protein
MTQREVRDDTGAQYHRGGCGAAPSNRSGDQAISSKAGLDVGGFEFVDLLGLPSHSHCQHTSCLFFEALRARLRESVATDFNRSTRA